MDKQSENQLISRITQAIREGTVSNVSKDDLTSANLTEEEIEALTDVIDAHIEERVREKVGAYST